MIRKSQIGLFLIAFVISSHVTITNADYLDDFDSKVKDLTQQFENEGEKVRSEFISGAVAGGIIGGATGGPLGCAMGAICGGTGNMIGGSTQRIYDGKWGDEN